MGKSDGQLLIVRLHHIFGSEELSAQAPSVAERTPKGYVILNSENATELGIPEDQLLSIEIDGQLYTLPVKLSKEMPRGIAGLPYNIPGLPFVELPAWGILNKQ
jgi:NADH-quinone oxidoreductase subunit G